MKNAYVAVDLGAETGRVVIGEFGEAGIELREVHRFANRPVRTPDGLHWDVLHIFANVLSGIESALADAGDSIVSVGVDSWGVDYGLFDSAGRLIANPYHYRDTRTDGMRETFSERVTASRQYACTGIAQLPINTLYQLAAAARDDRALDIAESLLMIPDIMHFWLTGCRTTEYTNASTTGMFGVDGGWSDELIAAAGVPRRIFGMPVEAATLLGPVRPQLELGSKAGNVHVVMPATHDTACAVLAAPLHVAPAGEACAYISSGTWSLLGIEIARPIVTEDARCAGFTNERGVAGSVRFLKNIMGLWLVQECRRAWHRNGTDYSYEELTARAATIASPGSIVDVDDPDLLHPGDMPAAINAQLTAGGQRVQRDPVALTCAIFEGLALQYRRSIADIERLAGIRITAIAIVGGGSRNSFLCQLAADACERIVFAGPAEASATGNVLVQAVADRAVSGLAQMRAFVAATARPRHFEPGRAGTIDWALREQTLTAQRAQRTQHV